MSCMLGLACSSRRAVPRCTAVTSAGRVSKALEAVGWPHVFIHVPLPLLMYTSYLKMPGMASPRACRRLHRTYTWLRSAPTALQARSKRQRCRDRGGGQGAQGQAAGGNEHDGSVTGMCQTLHTWHAQRLPHSAVAHPQVSVHLAVDLWVGCLQDGSEGS